MTTFRNISDTVSRDLVLPPAFEIVWRLPARRGGVARGPSNELAVRIIAAAGELIIDDEIVPVSVEFDHDRRLVNIDEPGVIHATFDQSSGQALYARLGDRVDPEHKTRGPTVSPPTSQVVGL